MFEWAHPYSFVMLLLPLLLRYLPAYRQAQTAVKVPFFKPLQALTGQPLSRGALGSDANTLPRWALWLIWACLVAAAAKPQWLAAPVTEQRSARDLMVAVDLSGSMATTDFTLNTGDGEQQVSRLNAVKSVLAQLAQNHRHDRLGLMVFGDAAYLQTPFTEDHATWLSLLNDTSIGLAGQSTMLGDAIGLAIKLFEQSSVEHRVLILLTDGNDTGSRVPPIDAAKVAASYGIKIYCIAIGDPQSIGEDALDIATLNRVAELSGGAFYQAIAPAELAAVQTQIAALEPEQFDTLRFQPRQSLHYVLVAVALVIALVIALGRGIALRQGQPDV